MTTTFPYSPCLLILSVLFSACSGEKPDSDKQRTVLLPAGQIHEGWYFGAGDEVRIEGTINGDAYVAGGNVDIGGTINGDLIVAGGMVTVDGTVSDDIRVGGGTVRISGKVGRSVTAAGGSVVIAQGGTVQSYLLAAGGNVQIAGGIGKGAKVVAGEMLVTGTIGEGLAFGGDKLTVAPGATIKGEVVAEVESPEEIHVTEGTVHGTVTIHKPVPGEQGVFTPMIGKILWALCLLFTALVLTLLFPRQIQRAGAILFSSVAMTTLWGVLGVIAIPIATIIIMITLVGLPVGLFVFFLYVWFLYLSQLSLGVVLAKWLFHIDARQGWPLVGVVLLGVLIVQLVAFIPYVRFVLEIVSVILGMGVLLRLVHEAFSPATRTVL